MGGGQNSAFLPPPEPLVVFVFSNFRHISWNCGGQAIAEVRFFSTVSAATPQRGRIRVFADRSHAVAIPPSCNIFLYEGEHVATVTWAHAITFPHSLGNTLAATTHCAEILDQYVNTSMDEYALHPRCQRHRGIDTRRRRVKSLVRSQASNQRASAVGRHFATKGCAPFAVGSFSWSTKEPRCSRHPHSCLPTTQLKSSYSVRQNITYIMNFLFRNNLYLK